MTCDAINFGLNLARPFFPLSALKCFLCNTVLKAPIFFNDVKGQEKTVCLPTLAPQSEGNKLILTLTVPLLRLFWCRHAFDKFCRSLQREINNAGCLICLSFYPARCKANIPQSLRLHRPLRSHRQRGVRGEEGQALLSSDHHSALAVRMQS